MFPTLLDSCIKSFDKSIEIKSDYVPALKARNKFYIKENKLNKALSMLEKLIIYESDNADLYVQKANVLLEMKKYEEIASLNPATGEYNPKERSCRGALHGLSACCCPTT